jgi:hypothetical protein
MCQRPSRNVLAAGWQKKEVAASVGDGLYEMIHIRKDLNNFSP